MTSIKLVYSVQQPRGEAAANDRIPQFYFMENQKMTFYSLAESDLSLLVDWLSRPHLQQWWREEEVTIDSIREKYLPRILKEEGAVPLSYIWVIGRLDIFSIIEPGKEIRAGGPIIRSPVFWESTSLLEMKTC